MHSRFLAMGIALAPSLPGGPLRRAAEGQAVVDASWALANRGDGTFDRALLIGTTIPQYASWLAGTVVGALAGDLLGDPERLGLDVLFPTFFVAILLAELRRPRARLVALAGAGIALALVRSRPPASPSWPRAAAALLGLGRRPRRGSGGRHDAQRGTGLAAHRCAGADHGRHQGDRSGVRRRPRASGLVHGRHRDDGPRAAGGVGGHSVFAEGQHLSLGADTVGVGVATVLLVLRVPLVVVCVVAVLVTVALRSLG